MKEMCMADEMVCPFLLILTNCRDKETLIKAYDQADEIQFPQPNINCRKSIFKMVGGLK